MFGKRIRYYKFKDYAIAKAAEDFMKPILTHEP
jgi:hypothetical protein